MSRAPGGYACYPTRIVKLCAKHNPAIGDVRLCARSGRSVVPEPLRVERASRTIAAKLSIPPRSIDGARYMTHPPSVLGEYIAGTRAAERDRRLTGARLNRVCGENRLEMRRANRIDRFSRCHFAAVPSFFTFCKAREQRIFPIASKQPIATGACAGGCCRCPAR